MECHGFIAQSLDGFIARPDGAIDWLMKQDVAGEDHGYEAFMDSVDGLIMGRGCYDMVASFDKWPYEKPVIVMSQSLNELPKRLAEKVELSRATPKEIVNTLAKRGWQRAYVDGGQILQSFLRAGLLGEIQVTQIPILLGAGRPLFGETGGDIDLKLIESRAFPSGLIDSRYKVLAR